MGDYVDTGGPIPALQEATEDVGIYPTLTGEEDEQSTTALRGLESALKKSQSEVDQLRRMTQLKSRALLNSQQALEEREKKHAEELDVARRELEHAKGLAQAGRIVVWNCLDDLSICCFRGVLVIPFTTRSRFFSSVHASSMSIAWSPPASLWLPRGLPRLLWGFLSPLCSRVPDYVCCWGKPVCYGHSRTR